ncbi:MAG: hypothetical protein IJG68_01815 [Bacilli bacterium]|nr:hypothetical protein [Bacilli bacterium]
MISIAIITLGICAVVCTMIVCITKYSIDRDLRAAINRSIEYKNCIIDFCNKFNDTYSNTEVYLFYDCNNIPSIEVEDVENLNDINYGE